MAIHPDPPGALERSQDDCAMPGLLRVRVAAAVIVLAVVVAACGSPKLDTVDAARSKSVASRCPSLGASISLGSPSGGDELALFTVDGSELVFAADGFSHGGVIDFGVGSTAVYVGNPDRMPVYVQASGSYTNVTHEFSIREGEVTSQTLPAGRYWMVASNFVDVTVRSCLPGGVTRVTNPRRNLIETGQTPGTSPRAHK
jgi:hypothetical protein